MVDTGHSDQNISSSVQQNMVTQNDGFSRLESAPLNPEFIEYQKNKKSGHIVLSSNGYKKGTIPSPVDLHYLRHIPTIKASVPAYYDLRNLTKVTSVKNQGQAGSCWAYASYGSLESYLMPGENWDFSENNVKNLLSSATLRDSTVMQTTTAELNLCQLPTWPAGVDL